MYYIQACPLPRENSPSKVRVLGVGRTGNHFAIDVLKLGDALREADNFSGTHEGEVHGIKEQDNILALVIFERYFFKLSINNCSAGKLGGGFAERSCHCDERGYVTRV